MKEQEKKKNSKTEEFQVKISHSQTKYDKFHDNVSLLTALLPIGCDVFLWEKAQQVNDFQNVCHKT